MRRNILHRESAKPIEQLDDGTWIIRYAIQTYSKDDQGNELVTFASSIFLKKPTLEQIKKSIHRYAMSVLDDEEILPLVANLRIPLQMYTLKRFQMYSIERFQMYI